MNAIDRIKDQIDEAVESVIRESLGEVSPVDLHLDRRSASIIYVFDNCIAVDLHEKKNFDYYGGGEYVDDVRILGHYVFYVSSDDGNDRIGRLIELFKEDNEEEEGDYDEEE